MSISEEMKKRSAEELVLEIKDKSELMVDLAYSSVLYDNERIAKEVYDLENLIDDMYNELQRRVVGGVKDGTLTENDALTLLRIGHAGEQIADAAQDIADVELRDVELHPILKMSIQDSDVVFARVHVLKGSVLCGRTLGELSLASETGMTVIAMRHKNRWLYGPGKNTRIDYDDILFAKGPKDGETHLMSLASGEETDI